MDTLHETALVQILAGWPSLASLVSNRITWDDAELDIENPAVRLRTLATTVPARDLKSRGGLRRCLVEVGCDDDHATGAAQLADVVIAALTPYESGPFSVSVSGTEVRFGSILLEDVIQTRGLRERDYRKTALFAVTFYE
jgi:hypothetical protein